MHERGPRALFPGDGDTAAVHGGPAKAVYGVAPGAGARCTPRREQPERRHETKEGAVSGVDIWEFRSTSGHVSGADLVGFHVEATDGRIGRVDRLSEEAGSQYLVVDTGPWIFGRHVLLPAGAVVRVDRDDETVHVDRTKDEIKNGPEYDPDRHDAADPDYRDAYSAYYGTYYGGPV